MCRVSFRDQAGIEHSCEVEALSMYEAAGLALARFKLCSEIQIPPGGRTELVVESRPVSVTHRLTVDKYEHWFNRPGAGSPAEAAARWRIRETMR